MFCPSRRLPENITRCPDRWFQQQDICRCRDMKSDIIDDVLRFFFDRHVALQNSASGHVPAAHPSALFGFGVGLRNDGQFLAVPRKGQPPSRQLRPRHLERPYWPTILGIPYFYDPVVGTRSQESTIFGNRQCPNAAVLQSIRANSKRACSGSGSPNSSTRACFGGVSFLASPFIGG